MDASKFYEKYWERPNPSPELDQLVAERQGLLQPLLNGLPKSAAVLDVGCGSGVFTSFFSTQGFEAVGLDISAAAISCAQNRYRCLHFHVGSLEKGLPFADDCFQLIWCTEVLEHLFDVHAALAEIRRVLKRDGLLVLTTPYHGLIKNLAIAAFGFERHYDPRSAHLRFFTRRSLTACLQSAGLELGQ